MNHQEPQWQKHEAPSTFFDFDSQQRFYPTPLPSSIATKLITTLVLLVLGYYILNLFDAWPSTLKRTLYESIIYLIPSQAIYILESIMNRFGRISDPDVLFRRSDFGNHAAKAQAIHRMLGQSGVPMALRKARSLSGLENIVPMKKDIGPPGLGNWDNSCYQNSVLQGLASLPAFQQYLQRSLSQCHEFDVPATTHHALKMLLAQLSDANMSKETLWTPGVLKSMDSWQQQDAQEYFSRILEAVEKENARCVVKMKRQARVGFEGLRLGRESDEEQAARLFEEVELNDVEDATSNRRNLSKHNRNVVNSTVHGLDRTPNVDSLKNPVDGMLAQALECDHCGFTEGFTLTQFNCLTLNLGLRGHCQLEDLLNDYTQPETVDGVECTKCTKALQNQENGTGNDSIDSNDDEDRGSPRKRPKMKPVLRSKQKQITVGRLPKDLVIHINRSIFNEYGEQRKNMSLIDYPARLPFRSDWCAPLNEDADDVQAVYELKCAVTHYGRHENGHYVAFGRRDKDWYCFNDEIVTKLTEEEVLSRGNVFMLFYEAVDWVPRSQSMPVPTNTITVEDAKQHTGSSSSASEVEEQPLRPVTPVQPIHALRTASGSVIPEQSPLASTPVVSAV